LRRTAKVDFSEVASVIAACAGAARKGGAPAVCVHLLLALVEQIRSRFPFRERTFGTFGNLLEREMHSAFGNLLQGHLRMLASVVQGLASRDPIASDMLWLKQSIQDRDVFQMSAFCCIAKAFGFLETDIFSCGGLLTKGNLHVANSNFSRGLAFFKSRVASWRQTSIQPSEYRPDAFIEMDGVPVIVDAKFRVPNSAGLVVHPDGAKDVQAYMDDFGVLATIIVVPRIFNRTAIGTEGYAVIEGNGKSIFVVELQDSDDIQTQRTMRKAIERAAQIETPAQVTI
jgi:hypothetical protein